MVGMAIEVAVDPNSWGQQQPRSPDDLIAEIATRQHGVIARRQLEGLGPSRKSIDYRVRVGRLHVIHRGVYAVGHGRITLDGKRMAAVLACGDGAALSHRDAAAAHGIRQCHRRVFEVTVPRKQRPRPGIQLHFARLPADEVTTLRGIPVTGVARTIFDLAAVRPRREVEMAIREAEVARRWGRLSLPQLVARHPGHRGIESIRAILRRVRAGEEITKEEMVSVFLSILDRANLPRPKLNRWILGYECDCVWPDRELMVELDGYAVHGTRRNFETDRERDRVLQTRGWRVIRLTWRQLCDDPDRVARDLAVVLA
jgi:very-short-patch-repair endonuclease